MKSLKNIFLYLLLSIISVPTFSQVPNYVPKDSLISWYGFNGNLKDTISGNLLTKTGNVNFSDSTVVLTNNVEVKGNIGSTSDISISTWIKSSDFNKSGSQYRILTIGGQNIISSQYQDTTEYLFINNDNDGKTHINKGNWINFTVVMSSDSMVVYLNGYPTKVITNNSNANNISIGAGGVNSYISIDNLGIWNRKLSQSEVKNLYDRKSVTTGTSSINTLSTKITIYPNPAQDYIIIDNNDYQNKLNVSILNSIGEVVFNSNVTEPQFRINTNELPNGIYFVNIIKDGNTIDTKKIIIQN